MNTARRKQIIGYINDYFRSHSDDPSEPKSPQCGCPSDEVLRSWVDCTVDLDLGDQVADHVAQCMKCIERAEELVGWDDDSSATRSTTDNELQQTASAAAVRALVLPINAAETAPQRLAASGGSSTRPKKDKPRLHFMVGADIYAFFLKADTFVVRPALPTTYRSIRFDDSRFLLEHNPAESTSVVVGLDRGTFSDFVADWMKSPSGHRIAFELSSNEE